MMPAIHIVGNLVTDPELKFTATGRAVVNFRVAGTKRKKDGDAWVDEATTFLNVQAWGTLAENAAESLTKGQEVIIIGDLGQREYETQSGEKRTVYEVTAKKLGPSLGRTAVKVQTHGKAGVVDDDIPF